MSVNLAAQTSLALMPEPTSMQRSDGRLAVDGGFTVSLDGYTEPRLVRAEQRFYSVLSRRTGILVWNASHPTATLHVRVAGPSQAVQQVGENESYHLTIDAHGATLSAANPLGAMHGLQTILQLVTLDAGGFSLPLVTIDDSPRFAWRGLMIDTSRHFVPLAGIERNLDGMEAVKLNVFHWHLSDDQGFRAESRVFPLLTERGSDGLFYTQEEMKAVIAYARDRGIRVVPEFDMPGHTGAILAAYPALGSGSGPYAIERKWGIFNPTLDPTQESTYKFVDQLVAEMSAIFPDAYFHIGGDECNGKEWNANPRIQDFMQKHGLHDDPALQAYFSGRVQKLVAAHGKVAVGWDEILQPGTASDVVIQSWHGPQYIASAARSGHKTILSKGYYLDLNLPAISHYVIDPLGGEAAQLTPAQQAEVLGGEAAMWNEYVSAENVESRIWPQAAVIAERLWSPANKTQDEEDMYRRMAVVSRLLENYGLEHASAYPRMLERIANGGDVAPFRVLGDVEEPTRQHLRARQGSYDSFTPLNRMVDAIEPESLQAREFVALCHRIAQQKATPEEFAQARALLKLWEENDRKLEPAIASSGLASELGPASVALRDAAGIGLAALDLLEKHQSGTATWREASSKSLNEDLKPHAAMVLAIVTPISGLVEASAGAGSPSGASASGK